MFYEQLSRDQGFLASSLVFNSFFMSLQVGGLKICSRLINRRQIDFMVAKKKHNNFLEARTLNWGKVLELCQGAN